MKQLIGVADSSSIGWETEDQAYDEPQVAKRTIRLSGRRGAPLPAWAFPVVARLTELESPDTPQQPGSRPLNVDDVADAFDFMDRVMRVDTSPPWIGRLSSGGVELAWRQADVEVEAVFDRERGEGVVYVVVGERDWEAPIDQAETLFATVADRLSTSFLEPSARV